MTWPRWAWALLGGILAAAGVLVWALAGGRGSVPAADPRAGGQAPARALAAAEARQVEAIRAKAADQAAELHQVATIPDPDARTTAVAELLNRRHRKAPP